MGYWYVDISVAYRTLFRQTIPECTWSMAVAGVSSVDEWYDFTRTSAKGQQLLQYSIHCSFQQAIKLGAELTFIIFQALQLHGLFRSNLDNSPILEFLLPKCTLVGDNACFFCSSIDDNLIQPNHCLASSVSTSSVFQHKFFRQYLFIDWPTS